MSHRRYLAGLAFFVIVPASVFLGVFLLGLTPGGEASNDYGSTGPVRIESIRVSHLPEPSSPHIRVEVDIKNRDQRAHEIEVWWYLAKPGIAQPWSVYTYRSSVKGQTLDAHEEIRLSWQEAVEAEPGTYELSAWVHAADAGTWRHSDGKRYQQTISIDGQWSLFTRRASAPEDLKVSAIDLPSSALDGGLTVPSQLPVLVTVTNDTSTTSVADVQWFLYRTGTRLPWDGKPVYTSAKVPQIFAPHSQTTVRAAERISLWPGEYLLRVVIEGKGEAENGVGSDDLFLNDTIKILDNKDEDGIVRPGSPTGPVEIVSLAVDGTGFQQGEGSVKVRLHNNSDAKQLIQLWWFLSRPGTLEPWVEFDFQSKVFIGIIDPQVQTDIELSDDFLARPGSYDLSVWVHTVDSQGQGVPSDGVWLNRRLEIR
jgi:hypothetical protein